MDTKKKIKNIKITTILWAFAIFIAIIVYIHHKAVTENLTFWGLFSDENFKISFLASAYEDIIFFLVIGIFLFILGNKSPEEDMLDNRINHLFTNNGSVDGFVLNKSKESIKKLAVFSDRTDVIIDIVDIIEYDGKKLLKIGFDKTYYLKSLIHDLDNLTTEGKLEFYGETQAVLPKNEYGFINILELRCQKEGITKIAHNEPLIEEKQIFKFTEKFKKDDIVTLYGNYWMWMLNGDILSHTAYRNTSITNVSVINKLSVDIIVTLTNGESKTLAKGHSLAIIEDFAMESLQNVSFHIKASD